MIPSTFTITPEEFEAMLVKRGSARGSSGDLKAVAGSLFQDVKKVHEFRTTLVRTATGRALTWLDMTSSPSSSPTTSAVNKGPFDRVFSSLKPILVQAGGLSWKKVRNGQVQGRPCYAFDESENPG